MLERSNRRLVIVGVALLLALVVALQPAARPDVCGAALAISSPREAALTAFAERVGLVEAAAFAKVAVTINETGQLPPCYLTKQAARARGWRPSRDLWLDVPGGAIGGNIFYNREGRLPARWNGGYREADLDFAGTARRGAHRLVFVADNPGGWTIWVTVDHYRSFTRVEPQ